MLAYMLIKMHRTTVYIDDETRHRLRLAAKARSLPEAVIIRESLQIYLKGERLGMPRAVGKSTDGGVARDLDLALKESGFGQHFAG